MIPTEKISRNCLNCDSSSLFFLISFVYRLTLEIRAANQSAMNRLTHTLANSALFLAWRIALRAARPRAFLSSGASTNMALE